MLSSATVALDVPPCVMHGTEQDSGASPGLPMSGCFALNVSVNAYSHFEVSVHNEGRMDELKLSGSRNLDLS